MSDSASEFGRIVIPKMSTTPTELFFTASIVEPESDEFIAGHAEVYTDADGYFITVETDSYEGCAMMTLPVAKRVADALKEAIEAAETWRAQSRAGVDRLSNS